MSDETQGQASQPAEGADEPVKIDAEVPQEKAGVEEEAKPEAAEKETEGEEGDEGSEGEEKPRKRSGIQKLKTRNAALLAENAELMRRLEQSKPAAAEGDDDKPPKEEDFKDWGEYIAEKAAYKVRQDRKAEAKAESERKAQADQASVWRERISDHQERIEEAKEVITDFDEVLKTAKGITIREELGAEIVSSEKSALIQYHLAKNQDELHRLNALSGRELAKEIGRLEERLKMPSAKQQTTARPPLASIKGGAAPAFDPIKTDDMDAFSKWLHKDLQKRSGR
jgi:hypothetical protein